MGNYEVDRLITDVFQFDHARCKAELARISRPKLDFTEEYLDTMSVERLRHVLVAAYLQAQRSA